MSSGASIKRGSSSLLILFIVFIFVLCSLFLILFGANVYNTIRNRVDTDFSKRMSISFITNKLRASDVSNGISILDDGSTLLLCSEPDEPFPQYIYIYHYDGSIMEYTTQDLEPFDFGDGEVIMAADSFTVERIKGGLSVRVGLDTEDIQYTVSLKSD